MTEGSKPNNFKKNNKNRNRNRNRNRNKNKNKNTNNSNPIKEEQSTSNKIVKLFGADKIIAKYDTLQEHHQAARKKLYEMFFRANKDQKRKLEEKFESTLNQLYKYEGELKDWEKEALNKKIEGYPMDTEYTSNHNIPVDLADPEPTEIIDEHVNATQKSRPDYSNDKDESIGSINDYYTYKGISPPAPPVEKKDEAETK